MENLHRKTWGLQLLCSVRPMLFHCEPRVALKAGLTRCLLCRQVLELAWREETFPVLQALLERQVSMLPREAM